MNNKIKSFFDGSSDFYDSKYKKSNHFYNYFFFERLNSINNYFSYLKDSIILDIGCGSCSLFYYLKKNITSNFSYYGNDISKKMINLNESKIDNLYHDQVYNITFPIKNFDNIFMLGVSSYLEEQNFIKNLNFVKQNLCKNSLFFVTTNNKYSLDLKIRNFLRPILQFIFKKFNFSKKYVLLSVDRIYTYDSEFISKNLDFKFKLIDELHLNHTFFPLNFLFPKLSISLAKFLKHSKYFNKYSHSDNLYIFQKID
jgi:SAM-dependent methyltransferase